jgi:hypothetical protein
MFYLLSSVVCRLSSVVHRPSSVVCQAGDLIKRSFEDIDSQRLIDYHTHIAGLGKGGTTAYRRPLAQPMARNC